MIIALQDGISRRLVDSLYVEAMLLADEARGYFDAAGRADRDDLPPLLRVGFSCESLRVTTRLMHVIAWLLVRRALASGEIGAEPVKPVKTTPRRRECDRPIIPAASAAGKPISRSADGREWHPWPIR